MRIIKAADLSSDFFSGQEMEDLPAVREIIDRVRKEGDQALRYYTHEFDGVTLEKFAVNRNEMEAALKEMDPEVKYATKEAAENLRKFARRQMEQCEPFQFAVKKGVQLGQRVIPVNRVGVYVPGGHYPLLSSLLMAVVPAQVAGVLEIAVCSPPAVDGAPHPVILAAARLLGVEEFYSLGGAQAVAAMAWGTESVPQVDKIVGPGNRYVALAQKGVFGQVGVDLLAGPTEIMIIADETASPEIIAADLLAQAEHDEQAVAVLVTTSKELAEEVGEEVKSQLLSLATKKTARHSIYANGFIILAGNLEEMVEVANKRGPEHLVLQLEGAHLKAEMFNNFGSLFIGHMACEVLGDYSSGLNHILPTGTTSRFSQGLSVRNFLRFPTTLRVTDDGFSQIAPAARVLARLEGLAGHENSLSKRE